MRMSTFLLSFNHGSTTSSRNILSLSLCFIGMKNTNLATLTLVTNYSLLFFSMSCDFSLAFIARQHKSCFVCKYYQNLFKVPFQFSKLFPKCHPKVPSVCAIPVFRTSSKRTSNFVQITKTIHGIMDNKVRAPCVVVARVCLPVCLYGIFVCARSPNV